MKQTFMLRHKSLLLIICKIFIVIVEIILSLSKDLVEIKLNSTLWGSKRVALCLLTAVMRTVLQVLRHKSIWFCSYPWFNSCLFKSVQPQTRVKPCAVFILIRTASLHHVRHASVMIWTSRCSYPALVLRTFPQEILIRPVRYRAVH